MMNFPKFEFMNFSPRENVASQLNSLLDTVLELSPSDAKCVASIERVGQAFHFEIAVYSIAGVFRARRHLDTEQVRPWDRSWHVPMVHDMCRELWKQLREWNLKRDI